MSIPIKASRQASLRGVSESDFTPTEQVELMTMSNDVRSLARFLGSLMLRTTPTHEPHGAER